MPNNPFVKIAACVLFTCAAASAETVYLTDGSALKGRVSDSGGEEFSVITASGAVSVRRGQVARIEEDLYLIQLQNGTSITAGIKDIDETGVTLKSAGGEMRFNRGYIVSISSVTAVPPAEKPAEAAAAVEAPASSQPVAAVEAQPSVAKQPAASKTEERLSAGKRRLSLGVSAGISPLRADFTSVGGADRVSPAALALVISAEHDWRLNDIMAAGIEASLFSLPSRSHSFNSVSIHTSGEISALQAVFRLASRETGYPRFYAAAKAGVSFTKFSYKVTPAATVSNPNPEEQSYSANSTQPVFSAGFGAEKKYGDTLVGLELAWAWVKQTSAVLKNSYTGTVSLGIKTGWEFN